MSCSTRLLVFVGRLSSISRPGLADRVVYVDRNGNSRRDLGEPFDVSDPEGFWEIAGLPPGDYQLRLQAVSGWDQTQPWSDAYEVHVTAGSRIRGKEFGSYLLVPSGSNNCADDC